MKTDISYEGAANYEYVSITYFCKLFINCNIKDYNLITNPEKINKQYILLLAMSATITATSHLQG